MKWTRTRMTSYFTRASQNPTRSVTIIPIPKINKEAKQIATNSRNLGQNYYPRQETSLYHHERIIRKTLLTPKCRLMNPAKSIIGRVSKQILKIINATTNTNSVINWFKSLEDESNLNFVRFDIVDFYPSISEELYR